MASKTFNALTPSLQEGLLAVADGYEIHHKTRDALKARGLVKVTKDGTVSLTAKGERAARG